MLILIFKNTVKYVKKKKEKKKLLDTGLGKGMFARNLLVFLSQNYKIQLIVIYGKSVDDRLNDVGNAELIV